MGHLSLRIIILKPTAKKKIAQKNPQNVPFITPSVFNKTANPIAINKTPKNINLFFAPLSAYKHNFIQQGREAILFNFNLFRQALLQILKLKPEELLRQPPGCRILILAVW